MDSVKENKMGTMPVFKLIISMSLPAMFSMLIQALYNVVDSVFVSKIHPDALTAVSLAFPVQTLLISVAVGTGIGINSLVSRRLGEKKQDEANSAATHGIVLGVLCGIVFAVLGIFVTRPFFAAFTNTKQVIDFGCQYIYVILSFSIFSFLQVNIEKTMQATGNMIYPMISHLAGAITNIILDPIMIFGLLGFPKLGMAGAAIATVTGQAVGMIICIVFLSVKDHEVKLSFKGFKLSGKTIADIYKVGFPSIVMQAIGSLLTTLLNFILVSFSEAAVSVLGVYYKLQSFVFMPVFGLNQGLMPILGYNFGAKNKKRIKRVLKLGVLMAGIIMALGTLLFELFPGMLLNIFEPDAEVFKIGLVAFRLIALCFLPAAVGIVFSTMFQAVGMGTKSLVISILRQLVVILPAAYLLSKIGLDYVWLAFPIAELVAFVIALVIMRNVFKNVINPIPDKD